MNLVLICSDTFRWDYLGCYGNEWIETPNLDAMAKESALYEQAFGEGLPTLPARRVMATGRGIIPMQYHAQHTDKVNLPGWHPLFFEDVTMAEHLLGKGYATCMVTDVYHMMKPGKNFHRGMEYWYWVRGVEDDRYNWRDLQRVQDVWPTVSSWGKTAINDPHHWLVQHINGRVQWQSEEDSFTGRVMTKAMDWVNGFHGDYPFFMWIDMFDPHEPWDPPVEYGRKYDPNFDPYKSAFPPSNNQDMTEEEFRCVKAGYAGECSLVDAWVGRFLDNLADRDLLDDTLIVFTSDHGGMMGENGEIHKSGTRLRNQVTQVPLLIRHPGGEAAGARVKGFVQHHDIMPTMLAIAGEDIPERCNGRNVWPLAVEGRPSEVEQIISCFGWHASVRNRKWNYIAPWAPIPEKAPGGEVRALYDLENDPEELTNVIDEHPEIASEMQQWMEDYLAEHTVEATGDLGPGQSGPEHDQAYI
ncbi:MAG: sulfatase-like hydrolase/transferase [candidate division WS1 bacterium]|jgi:arylsulfatase A-like enzyme|nr:sulfatase-like hydrolase/transferase [candidate division WS1 bacterium]